MDSAGIKTFTREPVRPPPKHEKLCWHVLTDIEGMERYWLWHEGAWLWPSTEPMTEQPLTPEAMASMGYEYACPVYRDYQCGMA